VVCAIGRWCIWHMRLWWRGYWPLCDDLIHMATPTMCPACCGVVRQKVRQHRMIYTMIIRCSMSTWSGSRIGVRIIRGSPPATCTGAQAGKLLRKRLPLPLLLSVTPMVSRPPLWRPSPSDLLLLIRPVQSQVVYRHAVKVGGRSRIWRMVSVTRGPIPVVRSHLVPPHPTAYSDTQLAMNEYGSASSTSPQAV